MRFSFLIPVYNAEAYLEQCVKSLLVQKGAAFEILLLDDGSSDRSPTICDELQSANPEIIRVIHKKNEGSLFTRRRGFQEASGDWILCIDADDYAAPDLLETVVSAIRANDGCDMVMYNYQYVDDQGAVSPSRLKIPDGTVFSGDEKQRLYEARLTGTLLNTMWMRAVRSDILDLDKDYSSCGIRNMCDDALQVLPLYNNTKKTVYIGRPLYYYRKGDGSITGRATLANWRAIHRSFVLEQPYVDLWKVSKAVQCKRYTKQMENICNCTRWLYAQRETLPDMSIPEAVRTMKEESLFQECLAQYDVKYATSRYSAISMPIIAKALDRQRFAFLKYYFKLENLLRR